MSDIEFRQILIDYLKGESIADVRKRIRAGIDGEKSAYHVYHQKVLAYKDPKKPEETHDLTIEFLNLLMINDHDDDEYKSLISLSLYQILTRLKGRHRHLEELIDIIHEIQAPQSWMRTILISILLCSGVGVFLYFYPSFFWMFIDWFTRVFPKVVHWLCFIFTEIRSVAIIGMAWQSGTLIYHWYDTFKHGTNPSPDNLKHLLFKTLGISMNIAGNVLMYLAHGSLGPIAAFLFIACSFMDVIESIYLLFVKYENPPIDFKQTVLQGNIRFKARAQFNTSPLSPNEAAHLVRLDKLRDRDLNILWIKLAAAALVTISIVLWCTLPSSVVLSLCFLIFGLLVNLAKDIMVKHIHNHYAEELQKNLRIVYTDDPKISAAARNEFIAYAQTIIDQHERHTDILPALNNQRRELSQAPNFNLQKAKEKFDYAVTIARDIRARNPSVVDLEAQHQQPSAGNGLGFFANPPSRNAPRTHAASNKPFIDIEAQHQQSWVLEGMGI